VCVVEKVGGDWTPSRRNNNNQINEWWFCFANESMDKEECRERNGRGKEANDFATVCWLHQEME
jgi:hypothetical protein